MTSSPSARPGPTAASGLPSPGAPGELAPGTRQLSAGELAAVVRECSGVNVEAERFGSPDVLFADLGVDSLGLLGVVAELERRLSVTLGADAEGAPSPYALIDLVNSELAEGT